MKTKNQISESIKRTMLENVVYGIADLRPVRTQVEDFRAQMVTNFIYEQYFILVLSTTQAYDAQYATKAISSGTRRSIYNSELQYPIPYLH